MILQSDPARPPRPSDHSFAAGDRRWDAEAITDLRVFRGKSPDRTGRPSRQEGLTLIELLATLGLLSALSLAALSWTQVAGQAVRSAAPSRWETAVNAVFRRIHDDLVTGDFHRDSDGGKVNLSEKRVRIRTRSRASFGGSVFREYSYSNEDRSLFVMETRLFPSPASPVAVSAPSVILGDLDECHFGSGRVERSLHVSFRRSGGKEIERTFRW